MNMMGMIFSNIYDEYLGNLTSNRTLASLPYGGRYRLVDFVLSNMVNSDITNVGIITKSNYQSLMDHLGNGKEWDLDRKKDGLFILPPFGAGQQSIYRGKIEALWGAIKYLERSTEEYIVLSDSNIICSIDYKDVLEKHIKAKADITIITKKEQILNKTQQKPLIVRQNSEKRVTDVMVNYNMLGVVFAGLGMYLMKRVTLLSLIEEAISYNYMDFEREIIQRKFKEMNMYNYEFDAVALRIDSVSNYFDANMELLNKEVRDEIFKNYGPVFTKVRDEVPTLYEQDSIVNNCLLADGCVIAGKVENSILFRGVKVARGAVIKNCILMQDTVIERGANIDYIITDKDVTITSGKTLIGTKGYPTIISKGKTV